MKAPLLVTDPFLATQPMTKAALDSLKAAGLAAAMFSAVKPNPVESNVYAGIEVLRGGKHDGVVAFGGGSALDAGKVIAFMAGQTRPMWDFEDVGDWWTRADPNGIAPVVAVPTTAGTGSEVGRAGVITQEKTHTKKVIFHPGMMPKVTICDPELTVGMPKHITAGTGLDALAHCLEAYCAPCYHPMADGMAVEGMRLVKDVPAARLCGRHRYRGAGPHDVGRRDGRDGLPEGARRHPRSVASRRARSTTRITASPTRSSCPMCWPSTERR